MKKYILCILYITCMTIILLIPKSKNNTNYLALNNNSNSGLLYYNEVYIENNYYEGEKIEDIINKVNRYLNSSLEGEGEFIVKYSIEKGVDPYLSTSVILLETGCEWTCSYLSRVCNNYGGNKGTPSCNGGSYRRFDSKEEGLKFAINKLASYYAKGKTTPEEIGPSYATSSTWAKKVNNYMNKLKN